MSSSKAEAPRNRNVYPRNNGDFADLGTVIDDFILSGQERLHVKTDSHFFLQGSCFAENLYKSLQKKGLSAYYNQMIEAVNSPIANLIYFKHLITQPDSEALKELKRADFFVFTVGVAPIWIERTTGNFVFQIDVRNMDRYAQVTTPVSDVITQLKHIFDVIYQINPRITILITLSPVALNSTFEFSSAIVADCISKSVLRTGIHEALRSYTGRRPTYFPAFEVVRWVGAHRGDAFGDDGLPRHVSESYVSEIVSAFFRNNSETEA